MAGGLFGQPFVLNPKCIVFSLICMALVLIKLPLQRKWFTAFVLWIVFVLAYVSMAWYDHLYECRIGNLERGTSSLLGYVKPSPGPKSERDGKLKGAVINWSHTLMFGPFVTYLGTGPKLVGLTASWLALGMAGLTAAYHGYRLMSGGGYINWIHIAIIVPVLVYAWYTKGKAAGWFRGILITLGITSILYHGYFAMKRVH